MRWKKKRGGVVTKRNTHHNLEDSMIFSILPNTWQYSFLSTNNNTSKDSISGSCHKELSISGSILSYSGWLWLVGLNVKTVLTTS